MTTDPMRRRAAGRITLVMGSMLAAGAASAQDGRFGAWDVACSARVYCVAAASGISIDGDVAVFKLERGPAPGSKVFVTTGPSEPLEINMRVDIDIKGLAEPYGVYGEVRRIYDGNEMTFGGGARRELVQMLRRGDIAHVSVAFGGTKGTITYHVPLSGLTLALLEIDRRQGRLDRTDAIVAWGGGDIPSAEAAPPPAPEAPHAGEPATVAAAPVEAPAESASEITTYHIVYAIADLPTEVVDLGRDELGCMLEDAVDMFGAQAIRFAGGDALYIVPCQPADANVESYVVLQDAGGEPDNAVRLVRFDGSNSGSDALITNPEYDEALSRITAHGYYSPSYDCGYYSAWTLDPASGTVTLQESRDKAACDGVVVAPADWPIVP